MAQTSTTLLASKSHIANVTGTDISFTATGSEYKITSTTTSLAGFAVRDLITVTGTTNNNKTFTVKTETSANELIVEEMGGLYRNYLEELNNDHVAAVQGQKPKPPRKSRFTDAQEGVIESIKNAQEDPENAPPIALPGFRGYYKWSAATQMFVPVDPTTGVVKMKNGEPAEKVTLEKITKFGRINGLRVKDITK